MKNTHNYTLNLVWTGDKAKNSIKNDRLYSIAIDGKPTFNGSADKVFHGNPELYNPEDLLLSSLSACHMMSYFYLCRNEGIEILSYQDNPEGILKVNNDGSGQFEHVTLKPTILISNKSNIERAQQLHAKAGKLCFIANSVNFEILYNSQIESK